MSKHCSLLLAPVLAAVAVGCATFPPPEERKPEADPALLDDNEPETTAEWLFVTSEGERASGEKAKCDKVAKWLEGEKDCAGEICVHARDLGREWLQRCEKQAGDGLSAMQDLVGQYEERADLPPDQCIRQGTDLLRTQECGEPETCEKETQKWISRCGPRYATPLFIVMLTRTLQRRFPDDPNKPVHRVDFDPRSCDLLAEVVSKGAGCDGPEPCRIAVEAADAWMDRCFTEDSKVPVTLAFQMADVRVGAGQGVDPIPINPLQSRLPEGSFPLQLEDDKGVVAWACGMRPKGLDAYLKTRAGCKPGEVIITRIDANKNVRAVSVPHADDEEFSRLFPYLDVKGERDARALADIEKFRLAIAEAVEEAGSERPKRAIPLLVRALRDHDWIVARQQAYQKILSDADAALAPAFEEWGRLKVKKSYRVRGRDETAMFAGRALQNPLNDMTRNGDVEAGTYAAPWPLALNKWMPVSFAAYKDAIDMLARTANRNRPSDDQIERMRLRVLSEIRSCSEAEKNIQAAADEAMECMSGKGCTQDKIRTLASAADPDRRKATRARAAILKILTTGFISNSEVERLEGERLSSGCLDP